MADIDIIGLYGEFLFQASYGGATFWMVDTRTEGGRRTLRFLFPGQDTAVYQDLGEIDGEIEVTGLVVGDDYVAQAAALDAAFRTPGPQTFSHPWLGEFLAVQVPERLPKIKYSADELRVARFTASFFPYTPPEPPAADTLQDLQDALDDIRDAANGVLDVVLGAVALTVAAIGVVASTAATAIGIWNGLIGGAVALVQAAAAAPLAVLGAIEDLTPDSTFAGNVGSAFAGVSAAIATTTTPQIPTAVAPGGSTTTPTPVDGRLTANLILAAITAMAPAATATPTVQMVTLAAQTLALADAVDAASDIAFTSQQEALTWQADINAALQSTATLAASLAAAQPTAAGTLWRALVAAQTALAADMSATIGRLAPVITFTPPASVPVWLLAQYLSGDNPANVLATYLDLVARNDIVNPAIAPAGPLEVLL